MTEQRQRYHLRFVKHEPVYIFRPNGTVPLWPAYWTSRKSKRTVTATGLLNAADRVGKIIFRQSEGYMTILYAYRETEPRKWEQVYLPKVLD